MGKLTNFFSQRTTYFVITFHFKQEIIQRIQSGYAGEDEAP